MKNEKDYLIFCNGSSLKNQEVTLSLSPNVAFCLKTLAKQKGLSMEEYINLLLFEHTKEYFHKNKEIYKKILK